MVALRVIKPANFRGAERRCYAEFSNVDIQRLIRWRVSPPHHRKGFFVTGLNRFLSALRCFDQSEPNWTVQELASRLNVPISTAYRTVRELVANGFLEPSTDSHYRLGSVFLEFDRMIRLTDPLVKHGSPLLRDPSQRSRCPASRCSPGSMEIA
jgi:hypothetical protein